MSEMIERTAVKLRKRAERWGYQLPHPLCQILAREVIEAMQEPTEAMLKADKPIEYTMPQGEMMVMTDTAPKYGVWQAMIDEALS